MGPPARAGAARRYGGMGAAAGVWGYGMLTKPVTRRATTSSLAGAPSGSPIHSHTSSHDRASVAAAGGATHLLPAAECTTRAEERRREGRARSPAFGYAGGMLWTRLCLWGYGSGRPGAGWPPVWGYALGARSAPAPYHAPRNRKPGEQIRWRRRGHFSAKAAPTSLHTPGPTYQSARHQTASACGRGPGS